MNEPQPPQSDAANAKGSESRTIWPGIGKGFAHEDLPKHLFTVAAMHARRALAAAENDREQLDRATSIGTAVELLAKAALALISPTLIAEKDPKSSLLYSGVPVMSPHEAKSKTATDCLLILKQSHSIDFNPQTDSKVFLVRNFALHMGQVDPTLFQEALGIMTRLNEALLAVIKHYESGPLLDRTNFWGRHLLAQVDERLKKEQEERRLELLELKEAAPRRRRSILNGTRYQLGNSVSPYASRHIRPVKIRSWDGATQAPKGCSDSPSAAVRGQSQVASPTHIFLMCSRVARRRWTAS
jgi:hypothetical protein